MEIQHPKSKSGEKTYSLAQWRKWSLITGHSDLGMLVAEYDDATKARTEAKQIAKLGEDRIVSLKKKIKEIQYGIENSDTNINTAEAAQNMARDAIKNAVDNLYALDL
jgi:hypothetical protein